MTATTLQSNDAVRKAAILVRSLDPDAVASLLSRMSPAEAKAIRLAVRELDEVTEDERQRVLQELRGGAANSDSGVELAFAETPKPEPIHEPPQTPATPRQRLLEADTHSLVEFLRVEQPATVAVVLSCLPPGRAAGVLDQLPHELQSHAMRRLAELGDIDPDSLNVITAELETWIARHAQDQRRREDRRSLLTAILQASSPDTRERIAGELRPHVGDMAPTTARPRSEATPFKIETKRQAPAQPVKQSLPTPLRPSYPFNQLETLSNPQLAGVLSRVDRDALVLSLVGASDRLLTRLRQLAGRQRWKSIEQSIARIGPVKLSDIQHAQDLVSQAAGEVLPLKGAA